MNDLLNHLGGPGDNGFEWRAKVPDNRISEAMEIIILATQAQIGRAITVDVKVPARLKKSSKAKASA